MFDRDAAYRFHYSLKPGDVIKIGKTSFTVFNTRYAPVFTKTGTKGNKLYRLDWNLDNTASMFLINGVNEIIGSAIARGFPTKIE